MLFMAFGGDSTVVLGGNITCPVGVGVNDCVATCHTTFNSTVLLRLMRSFKSAQSFPVARRPNRPSSTLNKTSSRPFSTMCANNGSRSKGKVLFRKGDTDLEPCVVLASFGNYMVYVDRVKYPTAELRHRAVKDFVNSKGESLVGVSLKKETG